MFADLVLLPEFLGNRMVVLVRVLLPHQLPSFPVPVDRSFTYALRRDMQCTSIVGPVQKEKWSQAWANIATAVVMGSAATCSTSSLPFQYQIWTNQMKRHTRYTCESHCLSIQYVAQEVHTSQCFEILTTRMSSKDPIMTVLSNI